MYIQYSKYVYYINLQMKKKILIVVTFLFFLTDNRCKKLTQDKHFAFILVLFNMKSTVGD